MKIETILGNIKQAEYREDEVDLVDIEWYDSQKAVLRRTSRNGRDLALCLPPALQQRGLDEGDVLWRGDGVLVAVHILPTKAIVLHPTTEQLVPMAYAIGNHHAPFFFGDDGQQSFAVAYDEPFQALFRRMGIDWEIRAVQFLAHRRISASVRAGHHHG